MKKWVMIALVCGLIAGVGMADVSSVNQVGYKRVVLKPGCAYHLVGLGFDPFDPTLMGVFGTNQLRGHPASPLFCDIVVKWNPAIPAYERYALNTTDNTYRWATNFTGAPVNPSLESGDGIWIITPMYGPQASVTNTIYLMGEVVDDPTNQIPVVGGGVGTPAYNLIAYPFSCDVDINAMGFEAVGYKSASPILADKIILWTDNSYKQFGLKTDGKWRELSPVNRWADPTGTVQTINLGEGFWYLAANSFVWSPTNIYLGNLR